MPTTLRTLTDSDLLPLSGSHDIPHVEMCTAFHVMRAMHDACKQMDVISAACPCPNHAITQRLLLEVAPFEPVVCALVCHCGHVSVKATTRVR